MRKWWNIAVSRHYKLKLDESMVTRSEQDDSLKVLARKGLDEFAQANSGLG